MTFGGCLIPMATRHCGVMIPPTAERRGSTIPRWSISGVGFHSPAASISARSNNAPPHAGHQSAFVPAANTAWQFVQTLSMYSV